MDFDADRKGSGTKEWSEHTLNIVKGCPNNCLYCYAAHNANRFNQRPRAEWEREEFTKRAAMTSYPARDGVVMFPSSHDITPFNLDAYIRVAKLILGKGNKLLIVTKPRLECIRRLLHDLAPFKSQILFRFTIGSIYPNTAAFWEPGAPPPDERIACLQLARAFDYNTSVSIEPMLGGAYGAMDVVAATVNHVTDTIWIGKMNKARTRVDINNPAHAEQVKLIEYQQCDEEILSLYQYYKDNPIIRWKDSIMEVVARGGKQAV